MSAPPIPKLPDGPGHRERLIAGLAASITERGYRATTITDVVRHARTSRRSFYEQFEDRDACFLALFDALGDVLIEHVLRTVDPGAPWERQVEVALAAYLDAIAAEPQLTVSFIREIPGLGDVGSARQRAALEAFAKLVMRLVDTDEMRRSGVPPVAHDTALMLVGGLRELVAYVVESGGTPAALKGTAAEVFKSVLNGPR
ncbi:TetR/AcrR family transcriptional regulator [Conexibacter sp. JD483]|uniref:TetR/AcrR family transcriptional regulator n=1 Tax=unclassified Conexibacter TaxID=2627773 RepID=UPI002716CE65|nr:MULTISPECIES: TetR/AcrR family transcriptional regulator [unclassified Conexibacter]MDO8186623.1 TetR/AcrR family transcriptional regulator [Conexibacter sp. CPCC 205706]MDO8196728.1 TetR/AcrR family transcriptional regulator [Conexibacter sp. CPCC 205762]MDR9370905.1 TetR/AcrR family transcriptional regulator [Conexibacter sp. JD483]